MSTASARTRRSGNARVKAFTLIEVLVVVAIIALLISILLPSLRQAREVARMTVCQTHLKEIGTAMAMYMVDSKDQLPGPIHPMFLRYPEQASGTNKFIMDGYINTRLRRYFSEKTHGKGSTTSQVGTCPSFPVADETFDQAKVAVYHYAVNSSDITAPRRYFGFTQGGVTSWDDWLGKYGMNADSLARNLPKSLGRVLAGRIDASREWMMADAFRRPLKANYYGGWPQQDDPGYQLFPGIPSSPEEQNAEWGPLANTVYHSGDAASFRPAPSAPFHMKSGVKTVPTPDGGGTTGGFYGKVNTLYFDLHAEPQEGWAGTTRWRRVPPWNTYTD